MGREWVWVIAVLLSLAAPADAEQQRQPEIIYIDEMAPPRTLRQMYADAALVARVTVEAIGSPRRQSGEMPVAISRHRVRVIEVFKGDELLTPAGGELTILQPGGTVNVDGKEFTTQYTAPLLQLGEDVILFLVPAHEAQTYAIAYGSAGVFTMKDGNAVVPKLIQSQMKEFSGTSVTAAAEFMANLRGMRPGRRLPAPAP